MPDAIIPLLTLIALEIILGTDNIIFISILADKLPENQRAKLRIWGIGIAMLMRLTLLAVISWILKLANNGLITPPCGVSLPSLGFNVLLLAGWELPATSQCTCLLEPAVWRENSRQKNTVKSVKKSC